MEQPHLVRPQEVAEILHYLDDPDSRGVLLLGAAGMGKSAVLRMVEQDLKASGRAAFAFDLYQLGSPGELGNRILDEIVASRLIDPVNVRRTLRTSAGAPKLRETILTLRDATLKTPSPVLLLDGLDASINPSAMSAGVEALSLGLDDWKIVVSSRAAGFAYMRRFANFAVIQLKGLSDAEAGALLARLTPGLSDADIHDLVNRSAGNPLYLQLVAQELQRTSSSDTASTSLSFQATIERLIDQATRSSSNPAKLNQLLEELALVGGRERVQILAAKMQISEENIAELIGEAGARPLLVFDRAARTVALYHAAVRDVILWHRDLISSFRLADLKFGAEEAERDDLLDQSFVRLRGLDLILDQHRSIVIGDRGSGKSAIFRKLASHDLTPDGHQRLQFIPVANTGDLLHRIVEANAWLDTDALRAAWLVVTASVIASEVPESASRKVRRDAADLRAALGFAVLPGPAMQRVMRSVFRILGDTTLTLAVGPVNLQAKVPSSSGGRPLRGDVDVESFMGEVDRLLGESGRRVVVMFDRIDETFKYDRAKQEAIVQALLQAEARISSFDNIGLTVFLRTDLFELYDIQEKNKLVSRTLTLDWSEDEWLQVLMRRVLANGQFARLASRVGVAYEFPSSRSELELLFPREIENQPFDQWITDSLRNGNGEISPRSAVLLLHLAREQSANPEVERNTLPIFTAEAMERAMTRLSELSFAEIVSDFKVAPSFVLNCRAGKLANFALDDIDQLFDTAEGRISEQVRLLERLGFLERVVQATGSGPQSRFRIPKLYTRCWDYA
jgi:hypothetical protein